MQNDRSEVTTVAVLGGVSEGGQNSNSIHRRQSSRTEGSLSFAKLEDVGGQGKLGATVQSNRYARAATFNLAVTH